MGKDGGHWDEIGVEPVDGNDARNDSDDEGNGTGNGVLEDALPELVGLPVAPDDSDEPPEGRLGRHGGVESKGFPRQKSPSDPGRLLVLSQKQKEGP